MRQRLCLAASTLGILLLFAACQGVGQLTEILRDLQPVHEQVSRLVGTDAVRVNIDNGRYLSVGVINSPLKNLPVSEKEQKALEIARLAYMSYGSRSSLQVVDVAFVIQATRLFFLNYSDGRDSFRFQAVDLMPKPAELSEGWIANEPPQRDLYFISIGEVPTDLLKQMVSHFQERFGVRITVLPTLSFDRVTFDPVRSQLVADELIAAVRMRYPTLARNPRTRVIAITPYDMYMRATQDTWRFTYSLRSHEDHFAVVSYARLDPAQLGPPASDELLRSRLRKMLGKNIGIMYFGLPVSEDPRSVLYGNILGAEELDLMSEFFDPQ
jgi:predicted Zn-dependent protease